MDWTVLASVGGGVAAAAVAAVTSLAQGRATDRAEARYQKDLIATFDFALRNDGGETVATPVPEPAGPAKASAEDARRRMASLPVEYHAQVLAQSRQSFIFSIGAAVIGFAIIAVAIAFFLVGLAGPGVSGLVGATIAEAVAALFFVQSNAARGAMLGQLEGFRAAEEVERQARERTELIQMVEDPAARDALLAETVLKLAQPERRQALPPADPGR